MFSNEETAEHANVCAETKFEESANSKEEKEQVSKDLQTFQNLVDQQKPLSSKFMVSSDESVKFAIRRNNVVDDVMRKMNMFFKNSVIKPITVEFVGEEATDDGGPLRELYSIFYDNAAGKLLCGPERNYSFIQDARRNEKCHFYLSGKFVAIGLLQGVPGPHCFCKPLVEYILSDDVTASTITVQLTDVPVFEVKEKLEAISNAQSEEELASCLRDFEERFVSGYNKFLIKLSDKADLLQKVSRYYVITRQLEAIQQFTSGSSSYSLLSSSRKFKAQAEKEFIYSPCSIISKYLQDLYTFEFMVTCDKNLKQKEKNIVLGWIFSPVKTYGFPRIFEGIEN